jgi:hypothetical protein
MSDADVAAGCYYTLDAKDCIVDYGGPDWNAFAADNGKPELAAGQFKGQSIYAQVAGHFTQRFLREFFIAARTAAAPPSRPYRCDSPRVKRFMEMRAVAQDGGALRVEHRLIAETAMAVEVAPRELPGAGRADFLRCSICNRLKTPGGEDWREPDQVGVLGSLRVVHTVCKDCRSGISARAPRRPETAA